MKKNKKGLSEIIGYVLLIIIAISLSLVIYAWMKNYLPKEQQKCPDGVSLMLSSYECKDKEISLTLKNNGLFNIEGVTARTSSAAEKLETNYLKDTGIIASRKEIFFYNTSEARVALKPGEEVSKKLNYSQYNAIVKIKIEPFIFEKGEILLCEAQIVSQILKNCN